MRDAYYIKHLIIILDKSKAIAVRIVSAKNSNNLAYLYFVVNVSYNVRKTAQILRAGVCVQQKMHILANLHFLDIMPKEF